MFLSLTMADTNVRFRNSSSEIELCANFEVALLTKKIQLVDGKSGIQ